MALKDRIQALIDAGFRKSELAKAAGKSPAAVTHWLNGETKEIKADSAAGLQALTGFSSIWISEGRGPKKIGAATDPAGIIQSGLEVNQPIAHVQQAPAAIKEVALSPNAMMLAQWLDDMPDDIEKFMAFTECMAAITRRLGSAGSSESHARPDAGERSTAESPGVTSARRTPMKANTGRRAR